MARTFSFSFGKEITMAEYGKVIDISKELESYSKGYRRAIEERKEANQRRIAKKKEKEKIDIWSLRLIGACILMAAIGIGWIFESVHPISWLIIGVALPAAALFIFHREEGSDDFR